MRKVLFVAEHGESPSAVYRSYLPARYLRSIGYDARVNHAIAEAPGERLYGVSERGLFDADIIITRKIADGADGITAVNLADRITDARKKGQIVFYDLDDDMWNVPDWNPAALTDTSEVRKKVEANIKACNGVIVSTPALAASVRVNCGVFTPVHICRSGINTKIFPSDHEDHKPLRIGWLAETRYRGECLYEYHEQIGKILVDSPVQVEFWQIGNIRGAPDVKPFLGEYARHIEIVRRPWVPYSKLPYSITKVDIGIIPEKPSRFALARSATTGLAFGACGIPYVATGNPEYEYLEKEYGIGITTDDWSPLADLIENDKWRKNNGESNRRGIEIRFDYHKTGKQWESIISSCG